MDKIKYGEFVCQVSEETGHAQYAISEILDGASNVVANNLNNGLATTIMKGVVIYPSKCAARDVKDINGDALHIDETIYPRAKFGVAFKKKLLFS